MAREDSQLLMEDMKIFIIVKSQLVPCSICALTRPHKMRYQLLRCSSGTCKAAAPYDACQWQGKALTCHELNRVTIVESGTHETLVRERRQPQLTSRLKDYGREMATQGLKPARIRMGMARRFGLSEADMPTLRQMQWFISHYTKKTLHRNDDYDEILGQIDQLTYGPDVSDTNPCFFLGGNVTAARLLHNAARDPGTFVLHIDATFKLYQMAYPVIVCRVSDRCRSFHLVALFITSQRLERLYVKALSSIRRVFTTVTGQQLLVKYVMADAVAGQQHAVNQVFGVDSDYVYLMCFYHVMAKVHEKLKGIPDSLCEGVVADMYDLHFASSQEVYDEQMQIVLEKWSSQEGFRSYFNNIWMKSEFWRWQCFHTPSGYATTNNPVQ
ncbi:hypothetical protein F441_02405 [Phytophthora nicotianae CJ01A1]|uniref:MULE transposase domain-containing protein n=1 Tax=Phytophthora nicotianae CJ01A1 TaxID=1317063 RepID=W2XPM2_PHYNI|nr:hypothetical protein F441_02405 [Phytophthora nicotianae CJ01A1]